jgi:hypothetical protein
VAELLLRFEGLGLLAVAGETAGGVSRRDARRRLAKMGGAAALATSLISSVVVSSAAATTYTCATPGRECAIAEYPGYGCAGTPFEIVPLAACGAHCTCGPTAASTCHNGPGTGSFIPYYCS